MSVVRVLSEESTGGSCAVTPVESFRLRSRELEGLRRVLGVVRGETGGLYGAVEMEGRRAVKLVEVRRGMV